MVSVRKTFRPDLPKRQIINADKLNINRNTQKKDIKPMKTRHIFLLLILGTFLTSCLGYGCALFTNNVTFVGDSVTVGIDSPVSYVDLISRMDSSIDCKEVAKAGGQVADAIKNFHKIIASNPYCVVIMYGLNDMKGSRTVFRNNLSTLVTNCLGMGYEVVIVTPSPHMELQSKLDKYADIAREVAHTFHCELADVNAVMRGDDWSVMSTVNHPNEKGHQIIADIVEREIP